MAYKSRNIVEVSTLQFIMSDEGQVIGVVPSGSGIVTFFPILAEEEGGKSFQALVSGLSGGNPLIHGPDDPTAEIGLESSIYLNTTTKMLFGPKTAGEWGAGVSLIGPTGPQGLQGLTGPAGKSMLSGSGNPSNGTGSDGDFYIDYVDMELFGPKTGGAWGAGRSMVGPTGATGPSGNTVWAVTSAPGGGLGANGDFAINTTNWNIYGPKSGGVWPAGVSLVGPQGPAGTGGGGGGGAGTTTFRDDVNALLTSTDARVQYYNTAFNDDRTITLPNSGLSDGLEFEIVRYTPKKAFNLATTSGGNTYYVDAVNGNNANNGLSPASAWQTLAKATGSQTWPAGTKILFKRGQKFTVTGYNGIVTCNGTASQPVIFDAYGTGPRPQLENTQAISDVVIQMLGSYGVVQNLEFIKSNPNVTTNHTEIGIWLQGSNHRVANCEFWGVGNGVNATGTGHRIDNNYFHDLIMSVAESGNPDNDYGAQGITIYGSSNIKVERNIFRRLRQPSPDYGEDGCGVEIFNANSDVEVCGNIFDDVMTVFEIGGTNSANVVSNITFHHNLVYNAVSFGIFQNNTSGTWGVNISGLVIDHNTIVKTGSTNANLIWFATAATPTNCVFRNNIVKYANVTNLFFNPGTFTHTNNIYLLTAVTNNANTAFSFHSSEKTATDPLFVNEAGADYHLSERSPAIGFASVQTYTTAYDLDNNALPTTARDAGCYNHDYALTVLDPLGGKNTVLSASRAFAKYRAVSASEWIPVAIGDL